MIRRPSVSVVIPAYNSGPLLIEALDSVLAQTHPAEEILVIDDGSTDDTWSRLDAYEGRVRRFRQDNAGVSAARNLGVRESRGDLIAFLDADDVWHPRKLELHLKAWDASGEGIGLLCTGCFDWPNGPVPEYGVDPGILPEEIPWWRVALKNVFTTSSILTRRQTLLDVGLFDLDLLGPEDHDLWIRVAEVARVARVDLPLTGYRQVEGSLSRNAESMHRGMIMILRKIEARGRWKGRRLLRRRAYALVYFSSAILNRDVGIKRRATGHLTRSLLWWPLPMRRTEVKHLLGRVRLLLALTLRHQRGGT